jgi:hypothetical protein
LIKTIPLNIKNLPKNPINGGIPANDKNKIEANQITYLFFKKVN